MLDLYNNVERRAGHTLKLSAYTDSGPGSVIFTHFLSVAVTKALRVFTEPDLILFIRPIFFLIGLQSLNDFGRRCEIDKCMVETCRVRSVSCVWTRSRRRAAHHRLERAKRSEMQRVGYYSFCNIRSPILAFPASLCYPFRSHHLNRGVHPIFPFFCTMSSSRLFDKPLVDTDRNDSFPPYFIYPRQVIPWMRATAVRAASNAHRIATIWNDFSSLLSNHLV